MTDGKMPKILLLFPNPIATIPGGLTYVGKRFKRNGFDVRIHINTFRNFRSAERMMEEVVRPYAPDIVGLSYATFNLLDVYRLQRMCRDEGYFVVAGGNHPSIRPEECLGHGADIVFRGEAEFGIDDFCSWYTAGRVPEKRRELRGASYINQDGGVDHNPKPPRIQTLDDLGEMDFGSLDLDEFRVLDGSVKGLNVISCGRGCPFRCSFCSHSDWYQYGKRSPDSIIQEMVNRNAKHGIETFWLSDETFTVDREHVHEFCRRIRSEKLPFKWMVGTRAKSVDERLLLAMKDAGLAQITYGIESADDDTLKRIRKGYTAKDAYDAVALTGRLGIPMYINLMTGFPWETPAHVDNAIRFIRAVDRYVYCFQLYGAVIPYPDTTIYDEYHEREGITDFWLREKYQSAGMVIYQNVHDPYKVSTYFQRNLYDDTYVAEDYFFRFTPEYKKAVARMGLLIGWKAIRAQSDSSVKRYAKYALGWGSQFLYCVSPKAEMSVVGSLMTRNRVHENRLTGRFIKR
jgi:radical SAM superfamily enzyme YgiQ (UPF0313 family)